MGHDECEFNQEGFCIAADTEFPEMKDNPCPLMDKKTMHCMAKPEDLVYVCPDCYREDCDGSCVSEETFVGPKTNSVNSSKKAEK